MGRVKNYFIDVDALDKEVSDQPDPLEGIPDKPKRMKKKPWHKTAWAKMKKQKESA